jgi:hypothetical protein
MLLGEREMRLGGLGIAGAPGEIQLRYRLAAQQGDLVVHAPRSHKARPGTANLGQRAPRNCFERTIG